jgi:hypothetical protein
MITISWMTLITILFVIAVLILLISGSQETGMAGGIVQAGLAFALTIGYICLWIGKLL